MAHTLTKANWATRAETQGGEILQLSARIRRDKLVLAAVRAALHLTEIVTTRESTDHGDSAVS
ncbi:hypothetical protein [Saccharopolyspora thermophila]|uniref:hypothetical protein n=1 Tax=Saccharopolyspora thermophila TaxID=89367 RepID=UPI001666AC0E|nr:hypothetical protein [Saccharopolyspora subtropica]